MKGRKCLRCGLVEQDHQAARLVDCPRFTLDDPEAAPERPGIVGYAGGFQVGEPPAPADRRTGK